MLWSAFCKFKLPFIINQLKTSSKTPESLCENSCGRQAQSDLRSITNEAAQHVKPNKTFKMAKPVLNHYQPEYLRIKTRINLLCKEWKEE